MKKFYIFFGLILFFILDVGVAEVKYPGKVDPYLTGAYNSFYSPYKTKVSEVDTTLVEFALPIEALSKIMSVRWEKGEPVIGALIETDSNVNQLEGLGLKVGRMINNIVRIDIPLSKLSEIIALPGIKKIEVGKLIEPSLNVSAPMVHAPQARNSYGLIGKGIIVGIVDTGIDITNPDFQDETGKTRILYLWDQTDNLGPPPSAYYYGTEWTKAQIDAGNCRQRDTDGHGTRITGIAVGNGRATGYGIPQGTYVRIAPEADLIVVKAQRHYEELADGILYVGSRAENLGKPWVVNLSLATYFGPKDGTSLFEQYIDGIPNQPLGKGKVIVGTAGNEGYDPNNPEVSGNAKFWKRKMNHSHNFGSIWSLLDVHSFPDSTGEYLWMELWYPGYEQFNITIKSPSGRNYGPFPPDSGTGPPGYGWYYPTDTDGLVFCHNDNYDANWPNPYPYTYDKLVIITLQDVYDNNQWYHLREGTWWIILSNGTSRWDCYITLDETRDEAGEPSRFVDQYHTNERKIKEPGNAHKIITVGSCNSKNSWTDVNNYPQPQTNNLFVSSGYPIDEVSFFSSPGPTRDGRDKPEIYAPGAWVASSLSKDASVLNYWKERDGKHTNAQGTSYSTPHVTGAVALLLQQDPDYTVDEIRNILDWTSTPENFLDVYEAVALYATGDVNGDGTISVADVVFLINYLFKGGLAPYPLWKADANGDCQVSLSDVVYLISFLFKSGEPPRKGCA